MIYYYYKNKKELFDEIIKKDYFDLLKRQAAQLKIDNSIDFYTKFVYGLNKLSSHDKKVYRLGIKVYLSFDQKRVTFVCHMLMLIYNMLPVYDFPLNKNNILGTLGFQLLLSGPAEEILYRALPITMLVHVLGKSVKVKWGITL